MSWLIPTFLRRQFVQVIRIEGSITELVVDSVNKHLKKINNNKLKALAVVINSNGGSPVQCNFLRNKLKLFSQNLNIPLYMFSERHALSGGYYILSAGDKVIVDQSAVIGHLGIQTDWKIFKKEKSDSDIQNFDYDELTIEYEYDIFENLIKQEELALITYIMQTINQKMLYDVQQSRQGKLKSIGFIRKTLLGIRAQEQGLVDEVNTVQSVLEKDFPKYAIQIHSCKSKFEAFVERIHKIAKIMKSRGFYVLLTLFGIKVLIKYSILFIMWKKISDSSNKQQNEKPKQEKHNYNTLYN